MIVSLAVASVAVVQATAVMAVTKQGGNVNKDENLNKQQKGWRTISDNKQQKGGWRAQKGLSKLSKIDKIRVILGKWCKIHLQRITNCAEVVQAGVAAAGLCGQVITAAGLCGKQAAAISKKKVKPVREEKWRRRFRHGVSELIGVGTVVLKHKIGKPLKRVTSRSSGAEPAGVPLKDPPPTPSPFTPPPPPVPPRSGVRSVPTSFPFTPPPPPVPPRSALLPPPLPPRPDLRPPTSTSSPPPLPPRPGHLLPTSSPPPVPPRRDRLPPTSTPPPLPARRSNNRAHRRAADRARRANGSMGLSETA